jgi:hypothetical protein
MRTLKLFLLLASAILLTSPLFGQGVNSGDLRVNVTDPQWQPVPNASVIARNGAKGIERVASGNGD